MLGGSPLLQKRAYRVLSYLAASRPEWLTSHLQQMLELMLLASAVALSPAKRYRLRWVCSAECWRGCWGAYVAQGMHKGVENATEASM